MERFRWLAFIVFLLASLACQAVTGAVAEPTSTSSSARPSATMVPLPSITPDPVAATQAENQPQATPSETVEAGLGPADLLGTDQVPMGTPFQDDSFHGIKLMPGAMNASEINDVLTYTVPAGIEDVLAYYQQELEAEGWQFLSGDTASPDSKILIYSKDDKMATVALNPYPQDTSLTLVIVAVP